MKTEHLGDGAYATIDRDFLGQVILTANDHDIDRATDVIHTDQRGIMQIVAMMKEEEKARANSK
jgi:hypothetical protein